MSLSDIATLVLAACLIVAAILLANITSAQARYRWLRAIVLSALAGFGMLLLGVKVAHTAEPVPDIHHLVLAFINEPAHPPTLLSWFRTRDACLSEADRLNRTNEALRTREARVVGAEYVCLAQVRVSM